MPDAFSGNRMVSVGIGLLVGLGTGVVYTLGVGPWLQQRGLRQTRGLAGTFEAQLSRQGVQIRSRDGREVTRRWTDLGRLSADREHLFLYWKDGQVTLLPRRAFSGEDGEAEVRALIQTREKGSGAPGKSGSSRAGGSAIELELERTPEDLAHFAAYQNHRDPGLRARSWFFYALLVGMTIYLAAAVLPWWGAVFIGLVASAAWPRLYFGLLKRQAAAMLRQAGHRQVAVRLDAAGVTESAGASRARVCWRDVERIEQTDRLLLLYVDRLQAVVIPRRCLGADGEARTRLEQIEAWHAAGRARQDGSE